MGADGPSDRLVRSNRLSLLGPFDAAPHGAGQHRQPISPSGHAGPGPGTTTPSRSLPAGEPDLLDDGAAPRPLILDRVRPRGVAACLSALPFQPDPTYARLATQDEGADPPLGARRSRAGPAT